MSDIERLSYDVVVIGAGGSGLRAAIEARQAGKRTAVISKSLFGKAHTVMAEGGCAAAMGNVNPNDNWQVHFRDTHARRQVPQQLADGRAARQGGPGPGLGAGGLGRAVRPHQATARSASATSAATSTRGSPTSATGPAWR